MGVVFHVSTLFLMNIFFPHQLAMYLVFVDWPSVAKRLSDTLASRRNSLVPAQQNGALVRSE
jgi:hypothetical protein